MAYGTTVCAECGSAVVPTGTPGPNPRYCGDACRPSCAAEGCTAPAKRKGHCDTHRLGRRVEVKQKTGPKPRDPVERFWLKVDKSAGTSGCWPWIGCTAPNGYGKFGAGGGRILDAHRFSVELRDGSIPPGLQVDHMCHVAGQCTRIDRECPHRRCVNPAHLKVVTPQQNAARANHGRRRTAIGPEFG